MATTISRTELQSAVTFLQEFLTEQIPEGDFRPGTALHDLVIKSYAIVFSYMKKEIDTVRALQSVNQVLAIPTDSPLYPDDATEALDSLLSNWFLTRRSGIKVTGTIGVRFTRREPSLEILEGHRFFLSGGARIFTAINDNEFVHSNTESDYRPVTVGTQTYYEVLVTVESEGEGSEFTTSDNGTLFTSQNPATFTFNPISPFAISAIQVGDFLGGEDTETNEDFVERAKDAITKRDLSTFKSIAAVLLEQFSVIQQVSVIGYGDDEMQRDRIAEKNRCLILAQEVSIDTEESGEDYRLYLKLNERFGKNYPKDETGIWIYSDIHMYEGVAPKQDGFTSAKDHWVDAHIQNGLFLDSNQTIEIGELIQANRGYPFANNVTGNFTVSCWIKGRPAITGATANIVHSTQTVLSNGYFTISCNPAGNILFTVRTPSVVAPAINTISSASNTSGSVNTIKSMYDDGFSFVVASYQGNDIHLFIDGELQDSIHLEGKWTQLGDFVIGGSSDPNNSGSFRGVYDQVIYRNFGVTDVYVEELYERQKAGYAVTVDIDLNQQESIDDTPGLQFDEFFHVGGKVDIYCKTPFVRYKGLPKLVEGANYVRTTGLVDAVEATITIPAEPFYRLYFLSDGATEPTPIYGSSGEIELEDEVAFPPEGKFLRYEMNITDPMYLHSSRQVVTLTVSVNDPDFDIGPGFFESRFTYDSVTSFPTIESFVYSRENRIVAGDLLVKGFYPIYVSMHIQYALQGGLISVDEDALQQAIIRHVNYIKPGDTLEVSDIVALMYSDFGIGKVQLPLVVTGRLYLPTGDSFEYSSENSLPVPVIEDYINIHPVLAEMVSQRTVRYLAPTENITLEQII